MKLFGLFPLLIIMTLMFSVGALAAPSRHADIRVIHASPDAPAVDVLVDGAPAFSDLAFKDITGYATVPADWYEIEVVPAGATAPVVIDEKLRLKQGKDYTVVATDVLANIEPLVLIDKNRDVSHFGSRIRFVHASPDAPRVDIYANGHRIVRNLEFQEASSYVFFRADTYDIEIRVAGSNTVALKLDDIEVPKRAILTAVVVGQVEDDSLSAVLVQDNQQDQIKDD